MTDYNDDFYYEKLKQNNYNNKIEQHLHETAGKFGSRVLRELNEQLSGLRIDCPGRDANPGLGFLSRRANHCTTETLQVEDSIRNGRPPHR